MGYLLGLTPLRVGRIMMIVTGEIISLWCLRCAPATMRDNKLW